MMKELRKPLEELMSLALRVNMETGYCVFTDNSGHVDWVNFRICLSKEDYHDILREFTISYSSYEDKDEYKSSLERRLKNYEVFKEYLEDLLNTPSITRYKVDYDLGVTQVSKTFNSSEERAEWIANAPKIVGKNVIQKEPILTEYTEQRRPK